MKLDDTEKIQGSRLTQICSFLLQVFNGILDQGVGCLVVFEEAPNDGTYEKALDTVKMMGKVVESLYEKASTLS